MGKGGRGEELDPGQRDGLQGPAEEVKMVLVRQLGRGSQTDVQGQTGPVGTGIFRDRGTGKGRQVGQKSQRDGDGDPLGSPGWDVDDARTGSLPAPDIQPPCVATRRSSHTWVPPCTCAHPSPTVCPRMPGPASSYATCCMHWAPTCWPAQPAVPGSPRAPDRLSLGPPRCSLPLRSHVTPSPSLGSIFNPF